MEAVTSVAGSNADLWLSLEVAAALGRQVYSKEWRAVCQSLDIDPPERLLAELVERGLAKRWGGGWLFTHESLVERLLERADEHGDLDEVHEACAAVLEVLYPEEFEQTARSRARHWEKAGKLDRAVEALSTAIDYLGNVRGDFDRQRQVIDKQRELLIQLQAPETSPRRYSNRLAEVSNLLKQGEYRTADKKSKKLQNRANRHEDEDVWARAVHRRAVIAYERGALDRALERLERAEQKFRVRELRDDLTDCLELRGRIYLGKYDCDSALDYLNRAKDLAAKLGRQMTFFSCETGIAKAKLKRAELGEARRLAEDVVERMAELKARHNQASAIKVLGDVARENRDFERALKRYTRARQLWRISGSTGTIAVTIGIGLSEQKLGRFEEAHDTFERAQKEARDLRVYQSLVQLGLLGYWAHKHSWSRWDDVFSEFCDAFETLRYPTDPHGWLAGICATECIDHGKTRRAYSMLQIERTIWSSVNRTERVDEVDNLLETL